MDPEKLTKYLYIEKTPTWWVRSIYIFSIIAWALVLYGYSGVLIYDHVYRWTVGPLLLFFSLYYFASYGLNLFYKQFDLQEHHALLKSYWAKVKKEPSVDIFLPICGEDIDVLQHTWHYVSKLKYANKKVYVLDDSREHCDEHKVLAERFGFSYHERPDKGWMKKAGNLKFGYAQSSGEFVVIFDADFAPRSDFLHELLPYMDNPNVAIVQSPQYFEADLTVHKRSPLEYGAARVQEPFYRYIQVARNRFGGTICCGSNAIYRRSALDSIGGPVMAEHSEDARTGFALTSNGFKVLYVPIILAVGLCPSDPHSYFHQQHRWASGSLALCLSREFWQSKLPWETKMSYSVGLLFYLSQPLSILFTFQLFYFLFVYNSSISLQGGVLFYPALIWGYTMLFFFYIAQFRWGVFLALLMQTYSYSHAVFTTFLKSTVGWLPTNAKYAGVSTAFKQVTIAIYAYIFAYIIVVAIAVRMSLIHLFDYNYYSIQFWIVYNLVLSGVLLWHMYRTMEDARYRQVASGEMSQGSFVQWKLKTLGINLGLLILAFLAIVYV